ncbi:hypothetical protein LUZ63_010161 [Rhynchospora breviuscula]|uniref:Major facilitator superfamily (MFS) profile domain-containing protein n=1 Tax=Rhynchospora breviuscula TaxID=2022672 RepID=A0A9Q0HPP4_9POAL|nr:hypothetical protein LUZ63_010161 [Rhynchospora breviuscula]
MASDPEQPKPISFSDEVREAELDSAREPLINRGAHVEERFSVCAAILPFLFPALGGLLYGYDIGATSGATISLQSPSLSGTSWYDLSSLQVGLVVSGSLYGALIGSVMAFTVADYLGRRRELILSSLLYLIGALLTASAPYFAVLVVGRFIYGFGIGLAMHAAPMYIAETAPSQIRGTLISLKEFFIVMGMLLGYIFGSLFVDLASGWRYVYAASAPICIIMAIGMWWLPPSPRWLLLCSVQGKGSIPEAKEFAVSCLCRLRGKPVDTSTINQVDLILADLAYADEEKNISFTEIFQGKCLKAMTIGCGLVIFQQVTGQPSVLYYAATILQSAGFSAASDATRVSVLLGLFKLIMTGIAVLVVDKLGRRPLLLGGVTGIAISLFLLSSYYTLLKAIPAVAVVALLLYVGCYQLSFGPIGWLMISEIFPLRLRGRGLSIAVLVNFGSNALVTFAFSPLEVTSSRKLCTSPIISSCLLLLFTFQLNKNTQRLIRSDIISRSLFTF